MSPTIPSYLQIIYYEINKISTLGFEEFVGIVACYNRMGTMEVDFKKRGYSDSAIDAMKKQQKHPTVVSLGLVFTRSLHDFTCDNFHYFTSLFSQYDKHGNLPFEGSLSDQPSYIIEVFDTLKSLVLETQESERKKQESKNKHGK